MKNVTIRTDCNETVVIANQNTTIGYATFDMFSGELTYIFVNPIFRRLGYGTKLLSLAEEMAGCKLKPAPPISNLGKKFYENIKSNY